MAASQGRQQGEQKAGREKVVQWAEEESAFGVRLRGLLRSPWGLERSDTEEKTSRTCVFAMLYCYVLSMFQIGTRTQY